MAVADTVVIFNQKLILLHLSHCLYYTYYFMQTHQPQAHLWSLATHNKYDVYGVNFAGGGVAEIILEMVPVTVNSSQISIGKY